MKIKVKYLGHRALGNPYTASGCVMRVGETTLVDEREAQRLLRLFPTAFEAIDIGEKEPPVEEDKVSEPTEVKTPEPVEPEKPFFGKRGRGKGRK